MDLAGKSIIMRLLKKLPRGIIAGIIIASLK